MGRLGRGRQDWYLTRASCSSTALHNTGGKVTDPLLWASPLIRDLHVMASGEYVGLHTRATDKDSQDLHERTDPLTQNSTTRSEVELGRKLTTTNIMRLPELL